MLRIPGVDLHFLWFVGFDVLAAVVINVAILWYMAPCNPYVNQCFGGTCHIRLQGRKPSDQETSVQKAARQFSGM